MPLVSSIAAVTERPLGRRNDNAGTVSPADAQLSLHALDRVVASTSELYELWVEDAQDPEWTGSMAELRQRLERSTST